eukprot:SAG11_NODE_14547_length_608_cov_1.007859_2_plen_34_part_01
MAGESQMGGMSLVDLLHTMGVNLRWASTSGAAIG